MTAVSILGEWVATAGDQHQDGAYAAAHGALVDTLGCILAGAQEEPTVFARKAVAYWGHGGSRAAGGLDLAAPFAALVNGTAAHALDLDDNDTPGATHPSAVLVPALLATAQERLLGGRALLDAYIVGLEVIGRVGEAVNMMHYARGWHATATLGSLGAAAGCSRLLRLDPDRSAAAISLATSRAAGFKSQFGTMAKPAHAGLAAQTGVISAALAEAGLTASNDVLDGKWSLLSLQSDEKAQGFGSLTERLGNPLAILQYGLSLKKYPCCYYIARSIDGVLSLREQFGLTADQIESVDVRMPARNAIILRFPEPRTQNEARFSVPYCIATALLYGRLGLAEMSHSAVQKSEARSLQHGVTLSPYDSSPQSPDLSPDEPDTVTIHLKSGGNLSKTVRVIHGSAASPLSQAELYEKFKECASISLQKPAVIRAVAALKSLPILEDLREITWML